MFRKIRNITGEIFLGHGQGFLVHLYQGTAGTPPGERDRVLARTGSKVNQGLARKKIPEERPARNGTTFPPSGHGQGNLPQSPRGKNTRWAGVF